ncbi:uncharacterized protein L969DRAFT_357860 [Mixia osmundae IAM 14324]|uniref:AB hydrolase-1 domain-containing protein n=1 Tax=Mixia osmundae (strain CBS 9802 / IAM 14324 / JCM 22182 / KY 12970) TaxID=764103 RepID=G7E5B3_MIXOS|nr:uncharacterized protein L969DRAFT_357860 [Mixia osmundae IAM 14324]KEI40827.1 hypothetical protein L969DRAFT_357860 [Mixia osmundae IAM 14324]GAA98023.1 hypothetical protein E5Q_04703 [Mixia osmundae IAM 14324]
MVERKLCVAGLALTVYAEQNLESRQDYVLIFLLHGRTHSQEHCRELAQAILAQPLQPEDSVQRVIITLDHRNHGTRAVDKLRNASWLDMNGNLANATHALDMTGIQTGTALDIIQLIDFLPAYPLFNQARCINYGVVGISLGGHTAWHLLSREKRIRCAVPIIGGPDPLRLLEDRAAKTQALLVKTSSSVAFDGLTDIEREVIRRWIPLEELSSSDLAGKHVLTVRGGRDTLVPYEASGLAIATTKFAHLGNVEHFCDQEAGHEVTPAMIAKVSQWLAIQSNIM